MTSYPLPNAFPFPDLSTDDYSRRLVQLYEELRNEILNIPQISYFEHKSLSHKVGKYAGKTFKFFKKTETKTAFLLSAWAVETVVVLMSINFMLIAGTYITALLLAAFHLYATYALFALLTNQKK